MVIDRHSSILQTPLHTMIYIVQRHAGTRRRLCMNLSAKIIPPSDSAHMARQNSVRMCSSHCSLGEPSLACKALSDRTYVEQYP
jgi:hypothetical protein